MFTTFCPLKSYKIFFFFFKDVVDSTKRRSHGGDSKYGFATSVRSPKSNSIDMYASPPGESIDEVPLPPPPGKTGLTPNGNIPGTPNTSSSGSLSLQNTSGGGKRSQSQPPNRISPPRTNGTEQTPTLPSVPPKIDRQKKPSRRSGSSSNNTSGNNFSDFPQTNGNSSSSKANSLERHSHIRDMKMVMRILYHQIIMALFHVGHIKLSNCYVSRSYYRFAFCDGSDPPMESQTRSSCSCCGL